MLNKVRVFLIFGCLGRVINDIIFIFGWTNPLNQESRSFCWRSNMKKCIKMKWVWS